MNIQYTLPLMEEAVFEEVRRREEDGDTGFLKRYHHLLDPVYELPHGAKRETAFEQIYLRLFVELGFDRVVQQSISGFSDLHGHVERFILTKAVTRNDEGADLGKNLQDVGIKLRPERLSDHSGLQQFLQHELMHIADMLDEQFGYRSEERLAGERPTQENLVRERYKILWDTYIDGRLSRVTETSKRYEARSHEFELLYRKIAPNDRREIFERLWSAERLTHQELVEMARDNRYLLVWAGLSQDGRWVDEPAPGYLCPLCKFSTYDWADPDKIGAEQIDSIQGDYPLWKPEEGLCSRCAEAYQ